MARVGIGHDTRPIVKTQELLQGWGSIWPLLTLSCQFSRQELLIFEAEMGLEA